MAESVFESLLETKLRLSAVELAEKIRNLEYSAEEVMITFTDRIMSVNAELNAVVAERFEDALQQAREIDEMLRILNESERESLKNVKPFLGVPFTAKEAFAISGLPNTSGLVARKGFIADEDALVVRYLRRAGAIPLAVTNCSELCMWWEAANRVYGRTKNPFDLKRIAGGSSGGEGAILGAAGSVFGIGSDIGGSIRMPSFFNGIFGHKPTPGIVPNTGQFPDAVNKAANFLCTGPMCRYAKDLRPILKVMAGENASKLKLDEKVEIKDLQIFSVEDDGGSFFVSKVDPELKEAQQQVCQHLEKEHGVTVEEIQLEKLASSLQIWSHMMASAGGPSFCDLMGKEESSVNPFWEMLKCCVQMSNHTFPAIGLGIVEKFQALVPRSMSEPFLRMAEELRDELNSLLGDNGVLLYPSHPTMAPTHNTPLLLPFNYTYTAIFNVLYLPVTQCPITLSNDGLPMGIQVVASNGNDHLTLAVAEEIERKFGGWSSLFVQKQSPFMNK